MIKMTVACETIISDITRLPYQSIIHRLDCLHVAGDRLGGEGGEEGGIVYCSAALEEPANCLLNNSGKP